MPSFIVLPKKGASHIIGRVCVWNRVGGEREHLQNAEGLDLKGFVGGGGWKGCSTYDKLIGEVSWEVNSKL